MPSYVDYLKKARKLIEKEENWIKGANHDGFGGYCLNGALNKAIHGNKDNSSSNVKYIMHKKLRYKMQNLIENKVLTSLTGFNDLPETTHKDVLKLLDKAIKEISKKGI